MSAPILTAEIVRALLHYDPETGAFTWLPRPGLPRWTSRYAGRTAGYEWSPKGSRVTYRMIRIFDFPFAAHRLAFLYMKGEWPVDVVDHVDTDGLNNRWGNLRQATRAQNGHNSRRPSTNSTGFKGVSHCKNGRFRATIRAAGRQTHLGSFETKEQAAEAYRSAAVRLRGEFARAT